MSRLAPRSSGRNDRRHKTNSLPLEVSFRTGMLSSVAMNCQCHLYRGQDRKLITRRWFFEQCGVGLGAIALGQLFQQNGWAASTPIANPLAPKLPPFPAKAKNVIFLFMAGAPSHLELFDYKPELAKMDGKLPPPHLIKD